VSGNEYVMIQTDPANYEVSSSYYNRIYTDFSYKLKVKRVSGSTTEVIGCLFRGVDTKNTYAFAITTSGSYFLLLVYGDQDTELVPLTSSPYINTGLNTWNTLQVICMGPNIALYANGHLLTTVVDSTFTSGKVGVAAVASGNGHEVHFDDITFRKGSLGPAAPPPSTLTNEAEKQLKR